MEIAGGVTVLSILAHRSSHYSFTPRLCPALWSSPTASPGAGIHPAQPSCQHKRSSGPGICQPTQSTFSHSLLASPYWHSTAGQKRNVIQHSRASINKTRGKTAQDSSLGIHHMQTLDRPNRVSGGTGKQLLYSAKSTFRERILFVSNN